MEGYACNGDRGTASLEGSFETETFEEACDLVGKKYPELYDATQHSVWGCRLFPTEQQARATFG